MAYSATSKPFAKVAGYPADMVQCVMGAVSEDGIHCQRTDQPLLIRAEDSAAPKPNVWGLYDIVADRSEKTDIAAAHPEVLARMNAGLKQWQQSVIRSYDGGDYALK